MQMIQRLAQEQRASGAIVHGGPVRLAGQAADDADLDMEAQTVPATERRCGGWLDPATEAARMAIGAALVLPSRRVEITGAATLDGPGARLA
jgi:hypothetical protein